VRPAAGLRGRRRATSVRQGTLKGEGGWPAVSFDTRSPGSSAARPALTSQIVFTDQYRDRYVDEDSGRLKITRRR
jgi:hypothetical protein